jgi:hypothetical protein
MRFIARGTLGRLGFLAVVATLGLLVCQSTDAIEQGDYLPEGQVLVDRATMEIDRQVAGILMGDLTPERTFKSVDSLLGWVLEYNTNLVASHLRLDSPYGLLVTDGIADTLTTRLYSVLEAYVAQNPEERLTVGRQALEFVLAHVQIPPGRLLGFHFQYMAVVYATQADTTLAVEGIGDPEGIYDGALRHMWDLAQVYEQVHRTAGEKYMCRITQEDWIIRRAVCEKCGHRGLRFRNQLSGMRDDTTATCKEVLYSDDTSIEGQLAKIRCHHWGHIFKAACPQCEEVVDFSVPLPHYRLMQLHFIAGSEELPDARELLRTPDGEEE